MLLIKFHKRPLRGLFLYIYFSLSVLFSKGYNPKIIKIEFDGNSGTANAMVSLIKQAGGYDINYACVIDLTFLQGTAKLTDYCGVETFSVLEVTEWKI